MAKPDGRPDPLARAGAATEVAKAAPLEPPALKLLRPEHTPRHYLAALDQAGLLTDAVRFLAFALARREAVWWAIQCVRKVPELTTDEKCAAALAAAEKWATDPTDEHRRAAFTAAETAGFDKAASCSALAAFLSEGSLAPAHLQEVPPPPHASPAAAAAAVVLAALVIDPANGDTKFRTFLALGSEVAVGQNRWPESKPAPVTRTTVPSTPRTTASPPPPPPNRGWY